MEEKLPKLRIQLISPRIHAWSIQYWLCKSEQCSTNRWILKFWNFRWKCCFVTQGRLLCLLRHDHDWARHGTAHTEFVWRCRPSHLRIPHAQNAWSADSTRTCAFEFWTQISPEKNPIQNLNSLLLVPMLIHPLSKTKPVGSYPMAIIGWTNSS
jgi:hypothetical protein